MVLYNCSKYLQNNYIILNTWYKQNATHFELCASENVHVFVAYQKQNKTTSKIEFKRDHIV